MEILLYNTPHGLIPAFDEDGDKKRTLKIGETYKAKITVFRNVRFHRKYMAFMRASFACLPQKVQDEYFGGKWENWRNELELVVGSYDLVFSFETRKMEHRHRSIAFGKMGEEEFQELYDKVKNYAWTIIGKYVSPEKFDRLIDF